MEHQTDWERAAAFHRHQCPGLAIGVRVCQAATEAMGLSPACDEELVCVTETDACGVDAIQVLLGCTLGKGNLVYRDTGKQAFTFFRRDSGQAIRFYLKARRGGMEREEYLAYLLSAPADELFCRQEVEAPAPEPARLFASAACQACGESAPEHKMRLQEGKTVCLDCFRPYSRGW